MEARPFTPFEVSGKTILNRNTFQKENGRKRRKPPGRMEAGHDEKNRGLPCKRKGIADGEKWRSAEGERWVQIMPAGR